MTERPGVALPLLATFATQVAAAICMFAVPVLATEISLTIGQAAGRVGIYTGIAYATAMVAGLATVGAVDRYGATRAMAGALTMTAAGALLAMVGTTAAILLAGVLFGIGYGAATPTAAPVLAAVTTERTRPLVFSIKQTGVTAGGLVAGAALPPLALALGWREAIGLMAIPAGLALLSLVPIARTFGPAPRPVGAIDRQRRQAGLIRPIRTALAPGMRVMAFGSFTFATAQSVAGAFMVVILVEKVGLSLLKAGAIFSGMHLAATVGRIGWGFVAGRFVRPVFLFALLAAASAVGYVTLALAGSDGMSLMVPLAVFGIGVAAFGWNGVMVAEWVTRAPAGRHGEAAAGAQFITFLGASTAPLLAGLAADASGGFGPILIAVAAVSVLNAAMMLTVGLRERRRRDP